MAFARNSTNFHPRFFWLAYAGSQELEFIKINQLQHDGLMPRRFRRHWVWNILLSKLR